MFGTMECFIAKKVKISKYMCVLLMYMWIYWSCCYCNIMATSIVASCQTCDCMLSWEYYFRL